MAPSPMREHALALAAQGFRVFKLEVWGRHPIVENWPAAASADPGMVHAMWTYPWGETLDNNIGIATGSGLMVLDVDVKNGAHGDASLDYMVDSLELDVRTFTVRTPSGGRHFYFRTEGDVRNSVGALLPGLDVRGYHGYVVAPGSNTAQGLYEVIGDYPVAPAPDWLVGQCGRPRGLERCGAGAMVAGLELDAQEAIERAVHYLVDEAPSAVEGSGGDQTTFDVALHLGDMGVSQAMAEALMLDHWNGEKAYPLWTVEGLAVKVDNAYKYRHRLLGVASPEAEFGVVDIPLGGKPPPKRHNGALFYEKFDEIEAFVDDVYLVDDLLDAGALSVLYGGSGSGKTFVAMDIAWCIATGTEWNERKVRQGLVVYVSSEGGRRNRNRVAALRAHRRLAAGADDGETPFALVPCPVNLLTTDNSRNNTKALVALIRKVEADFGQRCGLLVIDTLARAMPGGDEHGPVDMGAFITNVDAIRAEIEAAVMLVHHTGKDKAKGARGWSGLQAAIDTEIEVRETGKRAGTMESTKQRDTEGEQWWNFELPIIEVGKRASDKKPVTSCVVHWMTPADKDLEKDFPPVTEQGEQYEARLLELMKIEAASELCPIEDAWVNLADWNSHTRELWIPSKHTPRSTLSAGVSDSRLKQLRQSLLLNDRVQKNEQNQWRVIGDRVG